MTRPDKTEAVQRFVSRFGKSTSAVGRPPVGEDPGITIQGQQEQEGESGNEGGSTGGNRSKGEKKRKDKGREDEEKGKKKGKRKGDGHKRHKDKASSASSTDEEGPGPNRATKRKKIKE